MPDRFYLTTSIAYANSQPGIHTLYEVIGADAIARWHRMLGDDTRFLTGTDEHSVNIAQSAIDEGRPPRDFVDENVALFKAAEDAPRDRGRPLHPDDRSGPRPGGPGDGPPGVRERRHLPRDVRGLVLPERGVPQRDRRPGDGPRHDLPEPPRRAAPVADRAELVLPPVGLPGAARAPLRRAPGLRPAGLPAQRDARLHPPAASRTSRSAASRTPGNWGIPFPIAENGETAQREDGSWDPEAGTIYVWFDALINYITGAGFLDEPGGVRAVVAGRPPRDRQGHRPLPHDLLAGDAVERRARGAAAGLGPRLAARGRRRADEQEPRQLPRPERLRRGVRDRRRALRRARARCRSTRTPRCRGTASSGATTPTSRTTSATS